jgi:hypothetical protein
MNFEILIDARFIDIFQDTTLTPVDNKRVLSLVNDFEDGQWRHTNFEEFIWDNIILTALSAQEREIMIDQAASKLRAAAKNLRLNVMDGDKGKGGELAEVVLYGIMHHHYKALPVVPKIFYKQNANDYAKGADSVHIVLEGEDDFSLWFGEAKFFDSIENVRLQEVVTSVRNSLDTKKLKKENSIITSLSDIDLLVANKVLAQKIKDALSAKRSIDQIKPKINVPILLLHQCSITASAQRMNDAYIEDVKQYHLGRASAYFEKQISALSGKVTDYDEIKFHIVLFPIPDKRELTNRFSRAMNFFTEA